MTVFINMDKEGADKNSSPYSSDLQPPEHLKPTILASLLIRKDLNMSCNLSAFCHPKWHIIQRIENLDSLRYTNGHSI